MGYVYKITSKTTGKSYIGITRNSVKRRWQRHIANAKAEVKYHFYHAIRKYGIDDFVHSIIEEVDNTILSKREIFWISYYNSYKDGYNSTIGGEGYGNDPNTPKITCKHIVTGEISSVPKTVFDASDELVGITAGTKLSEEGKEKRRVASTGYKHTPEAIAKIKEAKRLMGKPVGNVRPGKINVHNHKGEIVARELHKVEAEHLFCRSITNATKVKPLGTTQQSKSQLNKNNNLHLVGFYITRNQ